ncbi:DUF3489 domain-containing protein [Jannaschia helgolandensis]|uniref:DUF3489 domain-containing protein n=1 Tax=Jannaschia helgolandensis TaxID=188906 RepID=UPI003C7836E0
MTDIAFTPQPEPPTPAAAKVQAAKTTRSAQLRKLLVRRNGVMIAQIQTAFEWQPHTARAAISGLRKRGEIIERSETAKGSVYRIVPAEAAT